MSAYILIEDEQGETRIESYSIKDLPFEIGPGAFKGLGGTILGAASRFMMLRVVSLGAMRRAALWGWARVVAARVVGQDSPGPLEAS